MKKEDETNDKMSWQMEGMYLKIFEDKKQVLQIFLGEALECAPRHLVEAHIREIERSPWLSSWHDNYGGF
jgi:hypothetical protein